MLSVHALSIIIPVYNEVENIEILYHEIVKVLDGYCIFEVIFVDDASQDGTTSLLKKLAQDNTTLRVVLHKKNYGQTAAIVSGAKAAQYEVLLTLDGDGQNDPADIPTLIQHYQGVQTVVLGLRKKRDDSRVRLWSSRIANGVRGWILSDTCTDTGCGLKLFAKEAFFALPHFNHLHRFLPVLFKRAGYLLVMVQVGHRPRMYGQSKYGIINRLFVGIYDLIGVRWLLKRPCLPEVLNE